LLSLLFATHDIWYGLLLSSAYLLVAHIIFAKGWLIKPARRLQRVAEAAVHKHAKLFVPLFGWLGTVRGMEDEALGIASRDELREIIANDSQLLAPEDKARLLGAFDFGSLLIADAMVPREKIITVDSKETVGPVLLDRLHKDKHNIYVVVKKNLDHIQGFLYMHDLTPIDPDITEVADATRPTVHYLHANAPLQNVLGASLATGRQLFVVTDDDGKTKGLITLADALRFLNGEPLPKITPATKQ
jgi:CBS domain containing-hemolysin-like protein